MKTFVTIKLLFLWSYFSYSQVTITTKQELAEKTNFDFTEEWQYLTTDFYLFNEDKFNFLINNLGKEPESDMWGKLKTEKIEFLSLTANIQDAFYFNNREMTYPLFNFKIDYSKQSKYKTQISEEIEVIRLIDNLPLATSKGFIDAKIKGEAITDTKGNQIMRIVSQQLDNISKMTDPSSAVLTVVGELGSFLESSSREKQYQFNSTIRLYDDTKFSKKLHSINIYVYVPKDKINETNFVSSPLKSLLDTLSFNSPIDINKSMLRGLIDYDKYPFFVVVNYKSKYTPISVLEDQIDFEFIASYEQRVKEDCEEGLNTEVVCSQEGELISFYRLFASFKQSKKEYDLNYENQINTELNKNLFLIMKDYRKLLLSKESRDLEYKAVPSYVNDFEPRYKKLILIADQYLNESPRLIELKTLVRSTNELRNADLSTLSETKIEQYLGTLYSLELPDNQKETDEYNEIVKLRGSLENNLHESVYQIESEELKTLQINESNVNLYYQIKNKISTTNCNLCRTRVNNSLEEFQKRLNNDLREAELEKAILLQEKSKDSLTIILSHKECISDNIQNLRNERELSESRQFVVDEIEKTFKSINRLKELVNENISEFKIEELTTYINNLKTLTNKIQEEIKSNCTRLPELCDGCEI